MKVGIAYRGSEGLWIRRKGRKRRRRGKGERRRRGRNHVVILGGVVLGVREVVLVVVQGVVRVVVKKENPGRRKIKKIRN
jgi:hypothetical protein